MTGKNDNCKRSNETFVITGQPNGLQESLWLVHTKAYFCTVQQYSLVIKNFFASVSASSTIKNSIAKLKEGGVLNLALYLIFLMFLIHCNDSLYGDQWKSVEIHFWD